MLELLAKHGFVLILLAVLLEELGIPMPIPTDILIVLAGVESKGIPERVTLWFIVLNLASATGASGLYAICRRGGRPLIERFGRYVHLGPAQLARGERMLQHGGWWGIAIGRAIPGLRYVTVIACGLLNVPFLRFLSAHIVGSSVYIGVFLWLGAAFGPRIIDSIHAPELVVQLIWLLALAVGLPLLLAWFYYKSHTQRPTDPSRWRLLSALMLASFLGTVALGATWTAASVIAQLIGATGSLDVSHVLTIWLAGRGMHNSTAWLITHAGMLGLCIVIGVSYYEWVFPRFASHGTTLLREILGLAVLTASLIGLYVAGMLLLRRSGVFVRLWEGGGPWLPLTLGMSILCYACTTVYGRALSITVLPSFRRPPPAPAPDPAPASAPQPPASAPQPPELPRTGTTSAASAQNEAP
jgi:membrane protein DedA with SNARE-associated domain